MPFPEATLAEVRRSVRIRASLDALDSSPSMHDPVIDEYIRTAHRQLAAQFPWLRTYSRTEQVLTDNHAYYDLPDLMTPRGVVHVLVRHVDTGEYQIQPGMFPETRRVMTDLNAGSRPELYRIIDQNIEIRPAPDARYTHLIIEGYLEARPREDTDPITVDFDALVMLTTIMTKQHYALDVFDTEFRQFENYLSRTRAEQSLGEGFVFGARSVAGRSLQANRMPRRFRSWQDWRPW